MGDDGDIHLPPHPEFAEGLSPYHSAVLTLTHCLLYSCPTVRLDGEVPSAPHSIHQPTAPGAGEPVQAQQVSVQTQAF